MSFHGIRSTRVARVLMESSDDLVRIPHASHPDEPGSWIYFASKLRVRCARRPAAAWCETTALMVNRAPPIFQRQSAHPGQNPKPHLKNLQNL